MSFSQKHSGKVFVPWYNSSEWRDVYNILCLGKERNYNEALNILKVWKCRTPLLSAGVEGTLIILEALLVNNVLLSDIELTQIYAISLLRFLNICAANNEKQGTFYKTAVKNELPKWLINIRHDIAHDHKLPSNSMLKLGLNQCLEWIKLKYWKVQNDIVSDYVVTDESINAKIIDILNVYIRLNLNLFAEVDITDYDEGLMEKINYLISKKYNTSRTDVKGMICIVEEMLRQSCAEPSSKSIGESMSKILVNNNVLLSTPTEVTSEGNEIIPKEFRKAWTSLLNILYENGFIFSLLNQFLEVTNNIILDSSIRKVASLWISEIFHGLQKIKNIKEEIDSIAVDNFAKLDSRTSTIVIKSILDKKHPEYKNCLEFDSPDFLSFTDAEIFQEKVLAFPNNYTLHFLKSVQKFNNNTETYNHDTFNLVERLIWPGINVGEETFTVDHLEEIISYKGSSSDETVVTNVNTEPNVNLGSISRWRLVKETSLYQGCPLGILPHQNRNKNPIVI